MMITNKLRLDLQTPGTAPTIHAVQNDSYSRNLEIALYSDRKPFTFPKNGTVVIRYKKSDGKGGEYDTLPDGTVAWWAEQNILTVALAPQVLTTPGSALLTVTLIADGTQLSIFPIRLSVDPVAAAKLAESENYFYITGLMPAPASGKVGQYFRISAVNDNGRIASVEAVDSITPQKGIDYWTDTDKESIIQDVLAALGTPVFGTVDEENNIILTGELPDGTYTLKYESSDGVLTEIGTLEHSAEDSSDTGDSGDDNTTSYTNLADTTSDEWMAGYRLNSSITVVEAVNTYLTNFIPCQSGDVIRVKGLDIAWVKDDGTRAFAYFFGADKSTAIAKNIPSSVESWVNENDLWTYTVGEELTIISGDASEIGYCRLNGNLFSGYTEEEVIITVNQEIL